MSTRSKRRGGNGVRVLERDLYEPVCELSLFRMRMVCMAREVRFGRKRVDLVGLTCGDEIVAVEFKVRDWKRVIWQALINQLFADFSYIAVWHTAMNTPDLLYLRQRGIGVVSVNECGARTVRRAKPSLIRRAEYRDAMLKLLQGQDRVEVEAAVS